MMRIFGLALTIALTFTASLSAQETDDEAPEPTLAERRLGPVSFGGPRGDLRLALGTQFRFQAEWNEDGAEPTQLQLHRLRPVVLASFLDRRVRFKLMVDLAPRAFELIDLFVDVQVSGGHRLRFGAAKLPFSSHWDQGYMGIPFVDWGLTTRWFGGGRQLGLTAMNDPREPVSYALGIYTGQSIRASNGQHFRTVYGERRTNHLSLQRYAPLSPPHPELAGRVMLRGGGAVVAFSAAWDTRPEYAFDESLRLAIDGSYERGPLKLWGGAFASFSEDVSGTWMPALGGALVEGRVRIAGAVDIAARYAFVGRSAALRDDAEAYALGAIQSAVDEDRRAAYESVGDVHAEHELTLAVSAYLFGNDLKWVSDVSWLRAAGTGDDSLRVRSQLVAGF